MLFDEQNNVWLASTAGLVKLNANTNTKEVFSSEKNYKLNQLQCLVRDPQDPDILWMGTLGGLVKFNLVSKEYQSYIFNNNIELAENSIRNIAVSEEEIILGTWKASLIIFNKEKQQFTKPLKSKYPSSHNLILNIFKDNHSSIWVTSDQGIIQYDINLNKVKEIRNHDLNKSIIRGVSFIDSRNIVWFGYKNGLFKYYSEPTKTKFLELEKRSELQTPLLIREIINTKDFIYAAGQYSEGLYKINKDDNTVKTIRIPFIENSNNGYQITDMILMNNQNILILSGAKIVIFDSVTEKFSLSSLQANHPNPSFQTVIKDQNNNYWIGSREGGLFCLNFENNTIKNYKEQFNIYENGNHRWINRLYIDSENKLWIGKGSTNSIMDLSDLSIHVFNPQNKNNIKSYQDAESYFEDSKKRMWIAGASSGIGFADVNYFNKGITHKIDGHFSGIYKYDDSLLLTTGNAGLGELNINSISHKDININIDKKIKIGRPIVSDNNGNYMIGANNGIVVYNPIREEKNYKIPLPYISKVIGGGKLQYEGNDLKNKTFQFESKINNLSFSISSLGFHRPDKTTYQYKINDDWISLATSQEVNITNLSPGDYSFQIKACNSIGNCSEAPVIYNFTILTPWYITWWAYLIYALIVIMIAERFYRFQLSKKMAISESRRLKEVNQFKNTLFTNITHDFRTPLTVIKGMTDTMRSNFKNQKFENVEHSLEMIERNSDGLLHLVNEMLDLAKIESGNMELQLVQSDVIPFLKYLSESFSSYAEENQISLTVYSEIDKLIMDFDINKLTSIMSNLLSNAIKFTPDLGKIIVHINQVKHNEKDCLFIKVKDSGIGIADEELPNIFSRFYQTFASTIRKSEGTGIGLALTKDLVDLMNGTIEVKSKLDEGSEFSVMIPITRKAVVSEKVEIAKVLPTSLSKTKSTPTEQILETNSELPLLLIIEDNMDVAYYLKTCLKHKYETVHAVNGVDGIETALEKIPDVIISDVMMPGKDGFEVCATLKSDERTDHIPIIMLTAKATIKDRITGLSHGADAYLAKPFNKEELFTRLDQLVSVRKKLINKIHKEGFNTLLKKRTKDPKLQFLQKVVKLIHEDIGDSDFGAGDLASKLLISESQIYRKIKAITGKSTAVYIRSIRLQYAKDLLINTNKSISEVAYEVGFNDPSWFSRAFKDEFGYSPSSTSN
ncbi:MAG: response regulator [Bacteroidia bacterium]|nr:response regulator [Bacteroidia bacterium]